MGKKVAVNTVKNKFEKVLIQISNKHILKRKEIKKKVGWRDISTVKSTYYSPRQPEFGS